MHSPLEDTVQNLIPDWFERHRMIFAKKESLRFYYNEVYAKLLKQHLLPGPSLEIGSGPGFLSHVASNVTTLDIERLPGVQIVCDAHELHFHDRQFSNVFFVDVLHHLRSPLACFREISRVLEPGGRVVMIEPYTTPLSRVFYKYIHHEFCHVPEDPWNNAFPPNKAPMEGNAEILRSCLVDQNGPVTGNCSETGLRLLSLTPFACFSYLLTGGFQPWQFPLPLVRLLYYVENKTLRLWSPLAAVRCLAVLERA
jgi:SAM-dependent methyltransferase